MLGLLEIIVDNEETYSEGAKYSGDWFFYNKSSNTGNIVKITSSKFNSNRNAYEISGYMIGYSSGVRYQIEGIVKIDGTLSFIAYLKNGVVAHFKGEINEKDSKMILNATYRNNPNTELWEAKQSGTGLLVSKDFTISEERYEYITVYIPDGYKLCMSYNCYVVPNYGIELMVMNETQFKHFGFDSYGYLKWIRIANYGSREYNFSSLGSGKYYIVLDNSDRGIIKTNFDGFNDYSKIRISIFAMKLY